MRKPQEFEGFRREVLERLDILIDEAKLSRSKCMDCGRPCAYSEGGPCECFIVHHKSLSPRRDTK